MDINTANPECQAELGVLFRYILNSNPREKPEMHTYAENRLIGLKSFG
jgi:hypothetical protein